MTKSTYLAPSRIHGEGVFTRSAIRKGEIVFHCGGDRLRGDQVPEGARAMQIGEDEYLVEDPDKPRRDDFVNHSCEPNLGFAKGDFVLYALRDIQPDEELLFDYSTCMGEPGWSIPCACGAQACRGEVRSFDDLEPHDRRRLRPIALNYLRARTATGSSQTTASTRRR